MIVRRVKDTNSKSRLFKRNRKLFYKRFFLGMIIFFILLILGLNIAENFAFTFTNFEEQKALAINKSEVYVDTRDQKIKDFEKSINLLIDEFKIKDLGNASVIISDTNYNGDIKINSNKILPTASLYKLFVLWELQRQIALGNITEDTLLTFSANNDRSEIDGGSLGKYGDTITVSYARQMMIEQSNNTAAVMILEKFPFKKIDETLSLFNFNDTKLSGDQMTSSDDIYKLLSGILNKNLDTTLRLTDYDLMIALLKNQKINNALSEGLDDKIIFAHKTANLENVVHDVGIIMLPDGRNITVVVMTEGTNFASYGFLYKLGELIQKELITE